MNPSTWIRLSLCASGLAICACGGSAEIVGGSVLSPGHVPPGRAVAEYVPRDCRDGAGAPAERASRVIVIEKAGGRRVLVELRKGYGSLVVENSFSEAGSQVFQAVVDAGSSGLVVHDFRLPSNPAASGTVSAASRWKQVKRPDNGFRAYLERPALACRLVASGYAQAAGASARSGS